MARNALWLALLLAIPAALEGAVCNRVDRSGLSSLAATVLARIEASPSTLSKSSVPPSLLLSTCNRFDSIRIEGPDIYAAVRDAIAGADHEVDMAFYQWEHDSYASFLIGSGLIAAQARRTPLDPLLVRIVIDDIECAIYCPDRSVNHLYDSQKDWVQRGLDLSRVKLQFGTSPRPSGIAPNLHDKFVVADARRVVVTGANVENVHNPGFPWHDSGYVLEGGLDLPVEGQPTRTLKVGDGFQVPPETPHAGGKNGDKKTRIAITYVVEKGKPLASPA